MDLNALRQLIDNARNRTGTTYRPTLLTGAVPPETESTGIVVSTALTAARELVDRVSELEAEVADLQRRLPLSERPVPTTHGEMVAVIIEQATAMLEQARGLETMVKSGDLATREEHRIQQERRNREIARSYKDDDGANDNE